MSFFASEADAPWFSGSIDPSVRLPLGIPPVSFAPSSFGLASDMPQGGQHPAADQVAVNCAGLPAGCQTGGSYGTSGMYTVGGKPYCRDCAVKILGIGGLPSGEQQEILNLYLPKGAGK